MPKNKTPSSLKLPPDMKSKFLKRIGELWDLHADEFMRVALESEDKKVRVGWGAKIDFSETVAKLKTEMSFSEAHTDNREDDFDNPAWEEIEKEREKREPMLSGMKETRGRKADKED